VNGGDAFAHAAGTQRARIQQVITAPGGETRYWTTIEDGTIAMGMGDLDAPDATITQSYDTAVALAKRELSPGLHDGQDQGRREHGSPDGSGRRAR
jgi:hypothetical protein